jgi:hypothetical protein
MRDRFHAEGWDVVVRGPTATRCSRATVAKVARRSIVKPVADPDR